MTGSVSMPAVVAMLLLLLELLAPPLPLPAPPPLPPPFMALPFAAGEGESRLPLWCAWIGGLLGFPAGKEKAPSGLS